MRDFDGFAWRFISIVQGEPGAPGSSGSGGQAGLPVSTPIAFLLHFQRSIIFDAHLHSGNSIFLPC